MSCVGRVCHGRTRYLVLVHVGSRWALYIMVRGLVGHVKEQRLLGVMALDHLHGLPAVQVRGELALSLVARLVPRVEVVGLGRLALSVVVLQLPVGQRGMVECGLLVFGCTWCSSPSRGCTGQRRSQTPCSLGGRPCYSSQDATCRPGRCCSRPAPVALAGGACCYSDRWPGGAAIRSTGLFTKLESLDSVDSLAS